MKNTSNTQGVLAALYHTNKDTLMNQQRYHYWLDVISSSLDYSSDKKYFCSLRGLMELFQPPQDQLEEFKRAIKKISLGGQGTSHPHTYFWGKMGWFYIMPAFTDEWMEKALLIQQSIPSPYHCSICGIQLQRKRKYCPECAKTTKRKLSKQRYNENREQILLEAQKKYKKRKNGELKK